jgi:cell division septum initiation protein DivIVA
MRVEGAEARVADAHRQLEEAQRRPAAPAMSETDDTLRRTLVLAQRTADATIKEAKDEAARLLSEAREEAARTRSEAEAEARRGTEGARAAAEAEIESLLDTRDSLKRDIEALGDRMRDQRERIRSGINELERVLEDPTLLEPAPPIALTQVEAPGQTGRHSRVEIPMPPSAPSSLPMRKPEPEVASSGNGQSHEPAVPFLPGAPVSVPDAPPLPSRRAPELAPATPFAFNGNGANGNGAVHHGSNGEPATPAPAPWPSQLRTSLADDHGHRDGVIEPGGRPSEWGRPVFDREDEGEATTQFGGR